MADQLNATQRLQHALGAAIFEIELLRDRVQELSAERDSLIEKMKEAKPG